MRSINHPRRNTGRRMSPERGTNGRKNAESQMCGAALPAESVYSEFSLENLMNYDQARMSWDSFIQYTSSLRDKILEHLIHFKFHEQEELRVLCEITDGSQSEKNQRIITERMYVITRRGYRKPQSPAMDRKLDENLGQSGCRKESQSSGRMYPELLGGFTALKRSKGILSGNDRTLDKTDKSKMGSSTESPSCLLEELDVKSPPGNKRASNIRDECNGSGTNRNSKCRGSNDVRKYDSGYVLEEIDDSRANNHIESLSYNKKSSSIGNQTKENKITKSDAIDNKAHGYRTSVSNYNAMNVDAVTRKNEESSSHRNRDVSNNFVNNVIKNVSNAEGSAPGMNYERTRNDAAAAPFSTSDEGNVYGSFDLKCLLTYDINLMPYHSFVQYAFALKNRVLENLTDFWSDDQERLKVLCAITDGNQTEKNQKVITRGMMVIVQRAFNAVESMQKQTPPSHFNDLNQNQFSER